MHVCDHLGGLNPTALNNERHNPSGWNARARASVQTSSTVLLGVMQGSQQQTGNRIRLRCKLDSAHDTGSEWLCLAKAYALAPYLPCSIRAISRGHGIRPNTFSLVKVNAFSLFNMSLCHCLFGHGVCPRPIPTSLRNCRKEH